MSLAPPPEPNLAGAEVVVFDLELAGWPCRVEASMPDAAACLESLLGGYRIVAGGRPTSAVAIDPVPDGSARFRLTTGGKGRSFEELTAGPDWRRFAPVPGSTRRLYAETRAGEAPVLEALPDGFRLVRPELWGRYLQLSLLWLLLRERDVLGLHAAVSALDGHALALVGQSGSGKSTLSWALHQAGADYYGDECAFFTLPEHYLYVLARELRLRPGGLAALGAPIAAPEWFEVRPDDPKCAVPLRLPRSPCPRDRVSFFFMDGFAPQAALRPIRGREAVQKLLYGMVYREPSLFARLEVAAGLVDRYPCWSLAVGPPEETARLLAEYARRDG